MVVLLDVDRDGLPLRTGDPKPKKAPVRSGPDRLGLDVSHGSA